MAVLAEAGEPLLSSHDCYREEYALRIRQANFLILGWASARPAICFTRGFARPTGDNYKWHHHRKYRVPRLHRRLRTRASAHSEPHAFVPLARIALAAVSLSCLAAFWNETRNAGVHHRV
jgi:hypothetical protein